MLSYFHSNQGCYNACEMGLGKSVQAVVATNSLRPGDNPMILVICPAVMRLVWQEEFLKWGCYGKPTEVIVLKSKTDLDTKPYRRITIVSYELAATEEFKKWLYFNVDFLILDEAHYLKNPKAKRTKSILKHVWPKCNYRICLSGTPFTNNVTDGFTLFNKLAPYEFPDFWSFANTYAYRKNNGFGITYEGLRNADKLRKIINSRFFLRKTKSQVLTELPSKVYKKVMLDESYAYKLTKEQRALQEAYYADLRKLLQSDEFARVPPPPVSIMTIRREQGLKKVEAVADYVEILLEQNVPCVLFGIFRDVLDRFEERFQKYKPAVIHGDVNAEKRFEAITRFQSGDTNLFIGQITAAGVGITLTRAANVVFSELSYSPAEISQACDRVHRVGQKESVTIHYFAVEKSVDETIIDSVMSKARVFAEILKQEQHGRTETRT